MPNSTVLITGGCGFLGSHLAETSLRDGYRIVVVDNFATGSKSNLEFLRSLPRAKSDFTFIEADVSQDWMPWAKTLQLKDSLSQVFHFASPASPPHYQRLGLETMWANSIGLSHALQFADQNSARVVFASTSEVYGDPQISPQPESYRGNVNTMGPRSCYDEAKRFGEALVHTHNLKFKTQHGVVRIFNTYGPRMNPADGRVVINLLLQALRGEALTIYGAGTQTRSFCYVDDLISGIRAFAQTPHEGPLNIGNDGEYTIIELAEVIEALFPGKALERSFHELPVDDPLQRKPDLSLTKKTLGWEPRIGLREGLERMLEWLKDAKI